MASRSAHVEALSALQVVRSPSDPKGAMLFVLLLPCACIRAGSQQT